MTNLRKLRSEWRLCRMLRAHAWDDYIPGPGEYQGAKWGRTFHFRCVRCATERHDTIDALGELSARRYIYPDGYALVKDDVPTTQELRLAYMSDLRAERKARRTTRRSA